MPTNEKATLALKKSAASFNYYYLYIYFLFVSNLTGGEKIRPSFKWIE